MALKTGPFTITFLIGLYCSIGGFLYGFDSGVITPTLVTVAFTKKFKLNANEQGAVVSVYQGGGFVGALLAGQIGDRLGRPRTIFLGAMTGILGSILMTSSTGLAQLLIGRVFVGMAVAIMTSAAPVYASEIARRNERGRLSACTQFMVAMGFFVANWTGYGFKKVAGDTQWRAPFAIQMIPAGLLALGVLFLPESPRWLCAHGREEEARQVIHRLHGKVDDEATCEETYEIIRDSARAEALVQGGLSWVDILKSPSMRKRLFFGTAPWWTLSLAGLSFIQYFSPLIYKSLNFSTNETLLVTGLYGCMSPICTLLAFIWADRFGRRTMFITSQAWYVVAFILLASLNASFPPHVGPGNNAIAQRFQVAAVFSVSVMHSLWSGPVSWAYPTEVFTLAMRARGNGLAQALNYGLTVLLSQVSPLAFKALSWKYYLVFIATNFVCTIVFIFAPETKGRTLEDIAKLFGDDPRDQVSPSTLESNGSINKGSTQEIEETPLPKVER